MRRKSARSSDMIAYLYLILVSISYGFINTDLEIRGFFSTLLIGAEILLFIAWISFQRFNLKSLIGIAVLSLISISTYITTGETIFLIMIITAIIFSRLDYTSGLRIVFITRLSILIFIFLCVGVGVLGINSVSVMKGQLGKASTNVVAYGLGYHHPNQLASTIIFLILLYLCIKCGHLRALTVVTIFLIVAVTFIVTKNRTIVVISFCEVLLLLLLDSKNLKDKCQQVIKIICKWVMPICAFLSIVPALMMSTVTGKARVILYAINGLMGSRYTHSARVFENYPVPFFGGIFDFEKLDSLYNYSTVDNGYVRLLYDFGLAGFITFLILYWLSISIMSRKKEYIYITFVFAISVWAFSESILRSFAFNFTIVFWSELLRQNCSDYNPIKKKPLRIRL